MNNNVICNPKTEVPLTMEMNDCDYLNDVLSTEKTMGDHYATVMSEASNDNLYQIIGQIFTETKESGRDLFNLLFQKGWYKLEKADQAKINTVNQEYQAKVAEL